MLLKLRLALVLCLSTMLFSCVLAIPYMINNGTDYKVSLTVEESPDVLYKHVKTIVKRRHSDAKFSNEDVSKHSFDVKFTVKGPDGKDQVASINVKITPEDSSSNMVLGYSVTNIKIDDLKREVVANLKEVCSELNVHCGVSSEVKK